MRWMIAWMAQPSCVYYEEFRQRKADADIRQETAELMKQYRRCLEKYEVMRLKLTSTVLPMLTHCAG